MYRWIIALSDCPKPALHLTRSAQRQSAPRNSRLMLPLRAWHESSTWHCQHALVARFSQAAGNLARCNCGMFMFEILQLSQSPCQQLARRDPARVCRGSRRERRPKRRKNEKMRAIWKESAHAHAKGRTTADGAGSQSSLARSRMCRANTVNPWSVDIAELPDRARQGARARGFMDVGQKLAPPRG